MGSLDVQETLVQQFPGLPGQFLHPCWERIKLDCYFACNAATHVALSNEIIKPNALSTLSFQVIYICTMNSVLS